MSNGQSYSEETKAVVMAALLAGQSVSSCAKEYKIPKGTVSDWKRLALEGVGSEPTQKRGGIGESLLDLVQTEIESLRQISVITRDPRWIKLQSAADLAVFTGVKHDKLVRMLEAFNDSQSDAPES